MDILTPYYWVNDHPLLYENNGSLDKKLLNTYGWFQKSGRYPQIIHFNSVFRYKPSIFGIPLLLETSMSLHFFLSPRSPGILDASPQR